jgi:hypothetical protein
MVTLTGAEAVVADGIAAADDPCDGWARRCRDRSADRGDGTGRKQHDQHGTSHNGSLDSRSRPHEFLHSLTGRAPRMASGQDASRGRGLLVLNLPSGSQSLEPLRPSKSVPLYSHLSLTTSGCCRAPTSPAGAPFGLAGPFRGIG